MGSSEQTGCLASHISELWVCMGNSRNGKGKEGLRIIYIILRPPHKGAHKHICLHTCKNTCTHTTHIHVKTEKKSEKVAIDSVPSCILVKYEATRRDFLII